MWYTLNEVYPQQFIWQSTKTCTFKTKNINFGWKYVDDIFLRDEQRVKLIKGRITDIVRYATSFDKYTTINSKYAKQPFSDKSITKLISHLSVHLNVKIYTERKFDLQCHKFDSMTK